MSEHKSTILKNVLVNLLVATVTGSVVFAVTMTAVVKQVYLNTNDIANQKVAVAALRGELTESTKAIRADMAAADARSDMSISALAKLSGEQIQQTRELITLLRLQNRLMQTP